MTRLRSDDTSGSPDISASRVDTDAMKKELKSLAKLRKSCNYMVQSLSGFGQNSKARDHDDLKRMSQTG